MKTSQLPKVVVLLAAYNGENYIQEQIISIVNQVDVNVYIYISIDASTDRTLEICQQLQKKYINIFIINEGKYLFGSAGKNFYHLIKNVDFEDFDFIALSDQDDIWKPEKINRGIHILKIENAIGYSSDVECFWDNNKSKIIKKSYPQKRYDYFFEPAGPGCTYIFSKKLATSLKDHIKKHPDSLPFHHDWFIYAYSRINKLKWIIDKQPNIWYRQHANNQVGANSGIKALIQRLKKIKTGEYKKEVIEIFTTHELIKNNNYSIDSLYREVKKNPFQCRRSKKEALLLSILFFLNLL